MTTGTRSHTFTPAPVAQRFGKYFLLERIGAGGMAEVFRAVSVGPENFQRTVVIKRILPHLSQDATFVQMFIDEAKISALLSHPNLVQVFEFGKIDGSFFIAMEHVHGRTLSATQKKRSQLGRTTPVAAAAEIGRQLCMGLEHAHALCASDGRNLEIVHRDITPSNLMLTFHGAVKILDFGIARVAEGLKQSQTQVGALKGKLSYMSPEQIQGQVVDRRSDIFSLGVVLHELLSGRRLFKSASDLQVSRMILDLPIPPPSLNNQAVPAALDGVVMRALERHVDARYPTAGAMAADLERVMAEANMSPREHVKLLRELFPNEVSAPGNSSAIIPPELAAAPAEPPVPAPTLLGTGTQGAGRRWSRKHLLVSSASLVALSIVAAVAWGGRRGTSPAPAVAAAAVSLSRGATTPPGGPVEALVRCSLDSTPQDSTVVLVDSGEVLGRTPLTVSLPRSSGVMVFRFEKTGYQGSIHKVIPDLDKAIHVDLTPTLPTRPTRPAAQVQTPRLAADRRVARAPVRSAPGPKLTAAGRAARNLKSASPIDPFAM